MYYNKAILRQNDLYDAYDTKHHFFSIFDVRPQKLVYKYNVVVNKSMKRALCTITRTITQRMIPISYTQTSKTTQNDGVC